MLVDQGRAVGSGDLGVACAMTMVSMVSRDVGSLDYSLGKTEPWAR